jgi:hypothetical protein
MNDQEGDSIPDETDIDFIYDIDNEIDSIRLNVKFRCAYAPYSGYADDKIYRFRFYEGATLLIQLQFSAHNDEENYDFDGYELDWLDANGTYIVIEDFTYNFGDWKYRTIFINDSGTVGSYGTVFHVTSINVSSGEKFEKSTIGYTWQKTFNYFDKLNIRLDNPYTGVAPSYIRGYLGTIDISEIGDEPPPETYDVSDYDYIGNLIYDDAIDDDQFNIIEEYYDNFFTGNIKAFDLIVQPSQYIGDNNLSHYYLYINGYHNDSWTNPVAFIPYNDYYYLRWYDINLNITGEKLVYEIFHSYSDDDNYYWRNGLTRTDTDNDANIESKRDDSPYSLNGLYDGWSTRTYDLNYRMYYLDGFSTGQIRLTTRPDKDIWYWLDEITVVAENEYYEPIYFRVINETGEEILEPVYLEQRQSDKRNFLIPTNYGTGNWSFQARRLSQEWTDDNLAYLNFTVNEIDTRYAITVLKDYVAIGGFQGVSYTAYTGEMYTLNMILSGFHTNITHSFTSTTYMYDTIVTIDELFLCDEEGSFYIEMINVSDSSVIASSKVFLVSGLPENNIYTVSIVDRVRYTDNTRLTITRDGYKDYSYLVINENGIHLYSGSEGLDIVSIMLYFDIDDIGTCDVYVFDKGGTLLDDNAIHVTFEVYDPQAATGDEVIDTFIGIPDYIKGIIGMIITIGFVMIPFLLTQYFKNTKIEMSIPPVIYTIFGGCGVTFSYIFGLFGLEIVFFICVISAFTIIISYVWKERSD